MTAHCFYCGVALLPRGTAGQRYRTVHPRSESDDHVVPASRLLEAGHTGVGWRRRNIVKACVGCNGRKGNMWPLDWLVIMPDDGVIRLQRKLRELGCSQADISEAMAARAARI